MLALSSWSIDRLDLWTPTILAVGIVTTLLVFTAGGVWVVRRRASWARAHRERRQATRRAGNPVRILMASDAEPPVPLCEAVVVDRSAAGLGLVAPQEFPVGTVLRLQLLETADCTLWARVEIVNGVREGRHWRLGCVFAEMPSWNVLKWFG